jgi:hypothetical protein
MENNVHSFPEISCHRTNSFACHELYLHYTQNLGYWYLTSPTLKIKAAGSLAPFVPVYQY